MAVFNTSPTFVTNLTAPLLIGGTSTTQTLIYKTTTGAGAAGADHIFQVGNNGATEAMRILNSGFVGIGTNTPSASLDVKGAMRLSGSTSGYVGFTSPAVGGAETYTLPITPGLNGQVLTTNGTAGTPTLSWTTPAGGGITSLGGLTAATQTFALGTTGTAPAFSSATSTHTLNIPMAGTASVTAGLLSKTDFDIFNTKQSAITTSALLAAALSDESGTGFSVFSASPTFTGVPLAPTAAVSISTTQIATTQFVLNQGATVAPLMDGSSAIGTSGLYARQDHVHASDTSRAPAAGSASITTLGTIATGTWNGTAIDIAHGGTGATTLGAAQSALGIKLAGTTVGTVPLLGGSGIVANNICVGDTLGGSLSCATANSSAGLLGLISDETGTGPLVFGTSPTITNPVISNIAPAANFTMTQNAVVPFTSESASAVANTLYLKAGNVGIGTTTPSSTLDVKGAMRLSGTTSGYVGFTSPAFGGAETYTLPITPGSNGQVLTTNGTAGTPTLSWTTPAGGGITSLGGLTAATQTFALGTTGTAPAWTSSGTSHTLNIPLAASTSVTAGLLSKADYDIFNTKQSAITTSALLAAALSDESGTGFSVFSDSPTFTGVPLAPTAAVSISTTQIATTAFVVNQIPVQVLTTVITGLTTVANSVISATDSILVALAKLQAQVSGISSSGGIVLPTPSTIPLRDTDGSLRANSFVPNNTKLDGDICPDIGAISTDSNGRIMSCQ